MRILIGIAPILLIVLLFLQSTLNTDFVQEKTSSVESIIYEKPVTVETYNSNFKIDTMEFKQAPKRVIVVGHNNLESMLALGLGDRIIGTTVNMDSERYKRFELMYPEELKKIKNTFSYQLDFETAISLNPDFILGWRSTFSKTYLHNTSWWNQRGVQTYITATSNRTIPYGTIDDEISYLRDIGKIFHKEERAEEVIFGIHKYIDSVKMLAANKASPRVMVVELSGKSITNYDERWLVGDMVKSLGGQMICNEKKISEEDLLRLNPDVIFVVYFDSMNINFVDTLLKDPKYNSLVAVQNKRVYPVYLDLMYTTGIRTGEGLELLAKGMYDLN